MNRIISVLFIGMISYASQCQNLEWMVGFGTENYDLSREIEVDNIGGVNLSGINAFVPNLLSKFWELSL